MVNINVTNKEMHFQNDVLSSKLKNKIQMNEKQQKMHHIVHKHTHVWHAYMQTHVYTHAHTHT